METHNKEGNIAILELQSMFHWLGKRLKAVLATQNFRDLFRFIFSVLALKNQVGFKEPDMAPRTIIDHVEYLSTHAKEVETKVEALDVTS